MLGLLVISHGRLAEQLVEAVRTIVGEVDALEAVSIGWNDEVDDSGKRIAEGLKRVDRGKGVLVLTDMFGGTPTNLALTLHERDRIEIVTGVNLPMLIKFISLREELELHEAAGRIAEKGREAIQVASHLLLARDNEATGGGS
jgi:PTS system mannose-specific IIA component